MTYVAIFALLLAGVHQLRLLSAMTKNIEMLHKRVLKLENVAPEKE